MKVRKIRYPLDCGCMQCEDGLIVDNPKQGIYLEIDTYLCEKCALQFIAYIEQKITDYIQPERSKREDSQKCEMRCSEHCGNTVRDK